VVEIVMRSIIGTISSPACVGLAPVVVCRKSGTNIEAQRRAGDAAAPRDLADGQRLSHGETESRFGVDFKFT